MRRDDAATAIAADSVNLVGPAAETPAPSSPWPGRLLLLLILLLAAVLRLTWLDRSPPGLHPDEAANAWNAWCLLHTGMDEHGKAWPLFYTRAFNLSLIHI